MIYASKLIPLIISPLGILIIVLGFSYIFPNKKIIGLSLLLLLISSLPISANFLWNYIERDQKPILVDEIIKRDVVVVLSGMLNVYFENGKEFVEWADPDRFFTGLSILKHDKANFIVFTNGRLPWKHTRPEGKILREKAIELGTPTDRILVTSEAANTYEEAKNVKSLMAQLGFSNVILVTSAYHMERAHFIFESVGIETTPHPTDFRGKHNELHWSFFLPNANAFSKFSAGLREIMGQIFYKIKFSL